MRGVNQFESGMAAVPMCNFIGKLPIGRQIWAKFRCKILYGFGVQIGPPNFVIEKKKTLVHFILLCAKRNIVVVVMMRGLSQGFEMYFTVKKTLKYPPKLLRRRQFLVFGNHGTREAK